MSNESPPESRPVQATASVAGAPVEAGEAWRMWTDRANAAIAPVLAPIGTLTAASASAAIELAASHRLMLASPIEMPGLGWLPLAGACASEGDAAEAERWLVVGDVARDAPTPGGGPSVLHRVGGELGEVLRCRAAWRDCDPGSNDTTAWLAEEIAGGVKRVAILVDDDLDPRVAAHWRRFAVELHEQLWIAVASRPGSRAWLRPVEQALNWRYGATLHRGGVDFAARDAAGRPRPCPDAVTLVRRQAADLLILVAEPAIGPAREVNLAALDGVATLAFGGAAASAEVAIIDPAGVEALRTAWASRRGAMAEAGSRG